jgi:hypothetical protein
VHGEVSLDAVRQVRADGMTLNHLHWAEQDGRLGNVERVVLGAPAPAEPG